MVDGGSLTHAWATAADGVSNFGRIYAHSFAGCVFAGTDICSGQLTAKASLWPFFLHSIRVTVCSSPLDDKGDWACFLFNNDKYWIDCSSAFLDCCHAFSIWYLQLTQTARGRASFLLKFFIEHSLVNLSKFARNIPLSFLSKNSAPHVDRNFQRCSSSVKS